MIFYAPIMFDSLGDSSSALLNAVVIGATNVLCTFVGLVLVDRWGRRPLLIQGGLQMAVSQVSACVAGTTPRLLRYSSIHRLRLWPFMRRHMLTCDPACGAPASPQIATAIVLALSFKSDGTIASGAAIAALVLICVFVAGFAWSW